MVHPSSGSCVDSPQSVRDHGSPESQSATTEAPRASPRPRKRPGSVRDHGSPQGQSTTTESGSDASVVLSLRKSERPVVTPQPSPAGLTESQGTTSYPIAHRPSRGCPGGARASRGCEIVTSGGCVTVPGNTWTPWVNR